MEGAGRKEGGSFRLLSQFISLFLFYPQMNGITGLLITVMPSLSTLSAVSLDHWWGTLLLQSHYLSETQFTHVINMYFAFVCLSACVWGRE